MDGSRWHGGAIKNVRRFLHPSAAPASKFDRPFMQWIKDGTPKTMGAAPTNGAGARVTRGDGWHTSTLPVPIVAEFATRSSAGVRALRPQL